MSPAPPVLLVTGVAGAGKTTVAAAVAARLGWVFQEGDEFHPQSNVEKMRSGTPLNDADRAPWLARIGAWIDARAAAGKPGVVSCSALKRAYRATLREGRPQVRLVYLDAQESVVAARIATRKHDYWPPGLLGTQFRDLERPTAAEAAIWVDIEPPVAAQVEAIVKAAGLG